MGVISWIIAGLIAGWLSNQVMRGGRGNAATDIGVGIVGGNVGGYLAAVLFGVPNAVDGVNIGSIVIAVLGAVTLLFLVGLVRVKNTKSLTKSPQEIQSSASPKIPRKIETPSPPKASARKVSSGIIFMSYRRSDSADVTGRIYDRLLQAFGKVAVFKDVDSIPLGVDFKEYLDLGLISKNT